MEQAQLKQIIEAALMAFDEPMSTQKLANLFEEDERPEMSAMTEALQSLQDDCEHRGVELKQVASGWRYQAKQDTTPWIKKLWQERPPKYTKAFLETLALVAYRQPVTRAEIEDVRGVAVNPNIIKSLIERDWVKVVGHRDVPGRPELLGTTKDFLDYFNLKSLSELPTLKEIQDLDIMGTELETQLQLLSEETIAAAQAQDKAAADAIQEEIDRRGIELSDEDEIEAEIAAVEETMVDEDAEVEDDIDTEVAVVEETAVVEESAAEDELEAVEEEAEAEAEAEEESTAANQDM
tara:strand:+ start:21349 stop:22230 length:882 start_codon:yes stop_codon:yes gene_type:complete